MTVRSGNPTRFTRPPSPARRHERRDLKNAGVGETFKARKDYQLKKAQLDSPKKSFFGKVRDYFFGAKHPRVNTFAPNANYVGRGVVACDGLKILENGAGHAKALDSDLLDILSDIS